MNNYRDGLKGGPQFLWILDEKVAFSCLQQARERNFPPHIHGTCGPPFRPTLYDGLKIWMDGLADTCTERASEATTTCMRAFGSNSIKSSQREARRWIRNWMGGRCHETSPRNRCKADDSLFLFVCFYDARRVWNINESPSCVAGALVRVADLLEWVLQVQAGLGLVVKLNFLKI